MERREFITLLVSTAVMVPRIARAQKPAAKIWRLGILHPGAPPERIVDVLQERLKELGYSGVHGEDTLVVENSPQVHNLVVCTLCSCYPWHLLGLPPVWYKSAPYRSRAVIDPRGVLREFGLELSEDVEVRVWDSTAELRYLVLPERPNGSEHLGEEALATLVTRDAMIGVAKSTLPKGTAL